MILLSDSTPAIIAIITGPLAMLVIGCLVLAGLWLLSFRVR